jgi:hypothetical protein
MSEDPGDHGGLFDGGDDLQGAPAIRTVFAIDIKHPFEQARPTHTRRRALRVRVIGRVFGCILRWTWDDLRAQLSVGGEHAMEAVTDSRL